MKIPLIIPLILVAGAPILSHAQTTYAWIGSSGGSWSDLANWTVISGDGITYPDSGDMAILESVSSGTGIVLYDASASGTIGSLSMIQADSDATNELKVQNNLTIEDDITLGASAGTSFIYLTTSATTGTVTMKIGDGTGNLTINHGGVFELGSYGTTILKGNVTISGGVLNMEKGANPNYTARNDVITGNVTMTSGTIALGTVALTGSASPSNDNRLFIYGNLTCSGGSIVYSSSSSLTLYGATNDISGLDSYDTRINMYLQGTSGTGSLNQSLNLGATTIGALSITNSTGYSSGTKTISATTGEVGAITFRNSASGATITFALASDLTLSSGAAMPTMNNYSGGYGSAVTIDVGSYTFDLSKGAGAFKTVGQGTESVVWTLEGDGTIKARSFIFSTGTNTTNILGNITLWVTGSATSTAGTVIDLGCGVGSGTISVSSTLRYSGVDTAAAPAALVSNRTIGNLVVESGYLEIAQSSLMTGGNVSISGGSLDLNGVDSAGILTLASGKNFEMTGGLLVVDLGDVQDEIIGSGSASFDLSNATLSLNLSTGFDYSSSYTLFSGFSDGDVSDITITGYDTSTYTAVLGDDGVLSFSSVSEPCSVSFVLFGGLGLLASAKRWKHWRG